MAESSFPPYCRLFPFRSYPPCLGNMLEYFWAYNMKIFANLQENMMPASLGTVALPSPAAQSPFPSLPSCWLGPLILSLMDTFQAPVISFLGGRNGAKKSWNYPSSALSTFFLLSWGKWIVGMSEKLVFGSLLRREGEVQSQYSLYKSIHTMNCRIRKKNRTSWNPFNFLAHIYTASGITRFRTQKCLGPRLMVFPR